MPAFLPRLMAFALFLLASLPATAAAPDLHQLLRDYLQQQILQNGLEGDAHIRLDTVKLDTQPHCDQAEAFIAGQGALRSRFSAGLRCLAPSPWLAYVPVQLRVMGRYPVAARPLAPNTMLTEADLALREGDLLRLPAGAVLSLDDVLGHTTTQRVPAKQVLKYNTLQAPHSIMRGQTVTLEVRGDGFTVSGEGTALQAGEPGTLIPVRTPSGQTVHGRVLNSQTVLLM